jgi:hypothetical protein
MPSIAINAILGNSSEPPCTLMLDPTWGHLFLGDCDLELRIAYSRF